MFIEVVHIITAIVWLALSILCVLGHLPPQLCKEILPLSGIIVFVRCLDAAIQADKERRII